MTHLVYINQLSAKFHQISVHPFPLKSKQKHVCERYQQTYRQIEIEIKLLWLLAFLVYESEDMQKCQLSK